MNKNNKKIFIEYMQKKYKKSQKKQKSINIILIIFSHIRDIKNKTLNKQ